MIAITFTFVTSHCSLIITVCHIWWMSTKIKLLIQPFSKHYLYYTSHRWRKLLAKSRQGNDQNVFSTLVHHLYSPFSSNINHIGGMHECLFLCIIHLLSPVYSWSNIIGLFLPYLKNHFQISFMIFIYFYMLSTIDMKICSYFYFE